MIETLEGEIAMTQNDKKLTRVERLIRSAFAELLEEKEFSDIKVTDIIQRADVSRSAFYSHYEDKFDLIAQIEKELMDGFLELMQRVRKDGGEYNKHTLESELTGTLESAYFRYIASEARWWKLFMLGHGRSDFVQRFTHMIYEHFEGTAQAWKDCVDTGIPRKIELVMSAWNYVGTISYWIETGMKETPEAMGRILAVYWHRLGIQRRKIKNKNDGSV